jgi:hypothetical protein
MVLTVWMGHAILLFSCTHAPDLRFYLASTQVYASRYRPGGNLKQSLEATGVSINHMI